MTTNKKNILKTRKNEVISAWKISGYDANMENTLADSNKKQEETISEFVFEAHAYVGRTCPQEGHVGSSSPRTGHMWGAPPHKRAILWGVRTRHPNKKTMWGAPPHRRGIVWGVPPHEHLTCGELLPTNVAPTCQKTKNNIQISNEKLQNNQKNEQKMNHILEKQNKKRSRFRGKQHKNIRKQTKRQKTKARKGTHFKKQIKKT